MSHKKNIERFGPYVRDVADQMQLRDWFFALMDKPSKKGLAATLQPVWGRRYAALWLAKDFHKQAPEKQRHTIVHELIHAHFAAMDNPLQRGMKPSAVGFYVSAMEYGIDAMADIVAPFMPLPPRGDE